MTDQRMNPDLIHDVLDVLDRHVYTRADDEHTGRAILLISDLAHIYEGTLDPPFGPCVNEASPSRTEPAPPEPAAQDAVSVPAGEVKTLLAVLDIAADYKRDRAVACRHQHRWLRRARRVHDRDLVRREQRGEQLPVRPRNE